MGAYSKTALIVSIILGIAGTGLFTQSQSKSVKISLSSDPVQKLLEEGKEQAKQGNYQKAIYHYNQALQENPQYLTAFIYRGIAYHDLGEYQVAIKDFNHALRINPDHPIALYNRGESRSDIGDFDGAIIDLTKAIQLKPNYAEAYNVRAIIFGSVQGEWKMALMDLNQAIRFQPDYADAYYNRGRTYAAMQNASQAISNYTKAIKLNAELAEAYGNRGLIKAQTGDKNGGLVDLQHAADLFQKQGDLGNYQHTVLRIQQIKQN